MTPVTGSGQLAFGDVVEVREHHRHMGTSNPRRGTVVRAGKASAIIAFKNGQETIRYVKRVTAERGGRFRGTYKSDFHPISKLSARDIWIAKRPNTDRVWGGGDHTPTIIVRTTAIRDEIDLVVEDLRKYSEWLQEEP